jgi:hypothetical protein
MPFLDSPAALKAYLNRPGMATRLAGTARPTPQTTAVSATDPLEDLLDVIMTLARQHGWMGQYTYNAQGPDAGLHVSLVRTVGRMAEGILAEVHRKGEALTPSQRAWLAAWGRIGSIETYSWTTTDRAAIEARLSQRHA